MAEDVSHNTVGGGASKAAVRATVGELREYGGAWCGLGQSDCVLVVGEDSFFCECVRSGLQAALSCEVDARTDVGLKNATADSIILLVLARVSFTPRSAIECLNLALRARPATPVVLLSADFDVDTARAAIKGGASGYLSMSIKAKAAVEAVKFVIAGGTFVPAECVLATTQPEPIDLEQGGGAANPPMGMTPKEVAVIQALRQGKPNKKIAFEIGCSETTVKVHLRNIMRKLGVRNRTEAAIRIQQLALPRIRFLMNADRPPAIEPPSRRD